MKAIAPEHVRLLNATVHVRERLRQIAANLEPDTAIELYKLSSVLTAAMKARDTKPRNVAAEV